MDDFIFYFIFFALIIIIGNQARERQERETKGMTIKQKQKYFQDIKDRQKENMKAILFWLGMTILIIAVVTVIIYNML